VFLRKKKTQGTRVTTQATAALQRWMQQSKQLTPDVIIIIIIITQHKQLTPGVIIIIITQHNSKQAR
jgi:hypothetical protein